MPDPATPEDARARQSTRVPVPLALFSLGRHVPFVLFDARGSELAPEPATNSGDAIAYVSPQDLPAFRTYLLHHLHIIVTCDQISMANRAWAVHRTLLYETSKAFQNIDQRASLSQLTTVLREAAAFQLAHAGTLPFVDVILGSSYTAVTHAVETALCAGALAAADGEGDADHVFAIMLGGLFADIAKLRLPAELLERDGPLTHEEWRHMRQHPQQSVQMMRQSGAVVATALRGVLSHHERWDGGGYPQTLRGADIPYEARCIAIADSYSAMTVDRVFQARVDPFNALMEMASGPTGQFDPSLLRSFVLLLGASAESLPAVRGSVAA